MAAICVDMVRGSGWPGAATLGVVGGGLSSALATGSSDDGASGGSDGGEAETGGNGSAESSLAKSSDRVGMPTGPSGIETEPKERGSCEGVA